MPEDVRRPDTWLEEVDTWAWQTSAAAAAGPPAAAAWRQVAETVTHEEWEVFVTWAKEHGDTPNLVREEDSQRTCVIRSSWEGWGSEQEQVRYHAESYVRTCRLCVLLMDGTWVSYLFYMLLFQRSWGAVSGSSRLAPTRYQSTPHLIRT